MTSITKLIFLSTGAIGISVSAGFAIDSSTKTHQSLMEPYAENSEKNGSLYPLNMNTSDVLKWEPNQFSDEKYIKSKLPLRNYFSADKLRHQQNSNNRLQVFQAYDEINLDMRIYASKGNNNFSIADAIEWGKGKIAFSNWEYVDSLVTYEDKDIMYETSLGIPSGEWIDTAHRNGVKILPLIYQPNIADMITKDELGHYPYADQLIRMAKYYHLDGYFWNLETPAGLGEDINPTTHKVMSQKEVTLELQQLMAYLQEIKTPDMEFTIYDSLTGNGNVTYLDQLTRDNSSWLQVRAKDDNGNNINQTNISPNLKSTGEGTRINDTYFLNYNWYIGDKLPNSRGILKMIGRDPRDLYITTLAASVDRNLDPFFNVHDYYTPLENSYGMFAPEMGMCSPKIRIEGCELEWQHYWRGAGSDVRRGEHFKGAEIFTTTDHINNPEQWFPAQSRYFVQHSTIVSDHFRTTFNTGLGSSYWTKGQVSNSNGWHNLNSQDLLPTYKYIVDGYKADVKAEDDYSTAYEGGSSLQYKGIMEPNGKVVSKLYATKLNPVNKVAKITFKSNSDIDLKLGIWTDYKHYSTSMEYSLNRYDQNPKYYETQQQNEDRYSIPFSQNIINRVINLPNKQLEKVKSETINGWTTNYYDLSEVKSEIKYFGIILLNNTKEFIGNMTLNLGEINIGYEIKDIANDLPTEIVVDGMWETTDNQLNFKLDLSSGSNFDYFQDYYSLYQVIGNKEILLTKERDEYIYVMHMSKEPIVKIIVEKTDSHGNTARKEFELWKQN